MRMLSRSCSQAPARASAASIAPTIGARTRSASVRARPQLGSAGQASAQRSTGSRSSASAYAVRPQHRRRSRRGRPVDLGEQDVLLGIRIGSQPNAATISRSARAQRATVRRRRCGRWRSARRDTSCPSPCSCQPRWSGTWKPGMCAARRQLLAQIARKQLARPVLAALGDDVFQPRMLAVAAVAIVALQPHHRLAPRRAGRRARRRRPAWPGGDRSPACCGSCRGRRRGRNCSPAARRPRTARRSPRSLVSTSIVLSLGCREADLELPRQVALAVERVAPPRRAGHLLAVDPRSRDRRAVFGSRASTASRASASSRRCTASRRRRRHRRHGAHDVAACRQGRQQRLVDPGDRRLQIPLQDAVKLDALPRRDPQRAIGVAVGQRVERQVLVRGQPRRPGCGRAP